MNFLFVSKDCPACTKGLISAVQSSIPDLKLIEIEYDKESNKFLAYKDGNRLDSESPITETPSLFLEATDELLVGRTAIRKKIFDAN